MSGHGSAMTRLRRRWATHGLVLAAGVGLCLPAAAATPRPSPSGISEKMITPELRARGLSPGESQLARDATHGVLVASVTWASPDSNAGCSIYLSRDDGRTWKFFPRHPADPGPGPGAALHDCSDPIAASGPDGTLYVGAGWSDGANSYDVYLSRSSDGGRSWSEPMFVTGDRSRNGVDSSRSLERPDRPWIVVDQATGTIYVSVDDFVGVQRYVLASHNGGRTFSRPYPIADGGYPTSTPPTFNIPAAYGGIVAMSYSATAFADTSRGANGCPCPIFESSRDDGKSWFRYPAPFAADHAVADPTGKGRFALIGVNGSSFQVATTANAGRTWSRTVTIADQGGTPFHDWEAYSQDGVLAIGWKSRKPEPPSLSTILPCNPVAQDSCGPYDYWVVLSRDGGRHFGAPIRISHAASPTDSSNSLRDDASHVLFSGRTLFALWGDVRTSPSNPTPAVRALFLGRIRV